MGKKEIITMALVTALLLTAQAVPISAEEYAGANSILPTISEQANTLHWESTNMVVPSISISGKQISVSVVIAPKKQTTKSKGMLCLEKKSGSRWSQVTSWPIEATGTVSLTKTYTGIPGVTYRARVVVRTGADEIDATSTEHTL